VSFVQFTHILHINCNSYINFHHLLPSKNAESTSIRQEQLSSDFFLQLLSINVSKLIKTLVTASLFPLRDLKNIRDSRFVYDWVQCLRDSLCHFQEASYCCSLFISRVQLAALNEAWMCSIFSIGLHGSLCVGDNGGSENLHEKLMSICCSSFYLDFNPVCLCGSAVNCLHFKGVVHCFHVHVLHPLEALEKRCQS